MLPSTRPLALAVVTAVALCGLLPVALLPSAASFSSPVPAALVIVVCLGGLRLARLLYVGQQRLAEVIVWIFGYVFLGVAPLVQLRAGIDPNTTPVIDHPLDGQAALAVLLGLVAFLAGTIWTRREVVIRSRRPPASVSDVRVVLLALIGLTGAIYVTVSLGPSVFFSSRLDFDSAFILKWPDPTVRAIVRALSTMPLLVALVGWLQLHRGRTKFTKVLLPLFILVLLLIQVNPISSPRYVFGTTLLALFAAGGLMATPARFRATTLGIVTAIVFLFPFADAFRYSTYGRFKANGIAQALTTGDFDAFAQINNTVSYISTYGTTAGRQALGVLLFWVPRSLWQGKPEDTGSLLADFRNYGFKNLSAPLWSELLVNGGWIALVAGMLVFGVLVRRWDERSLVTMQKSCAPGVLGCILPFYLLIVLRGSLLQATVGVAVIVACYGAIRVPPDRATQHQSRVTRLDGGGRYLLGRSAQNAHSE